MALIPFTLAVGPATGARPTQEVTDFQSWTLDNNLDDGCSISFTTRGDSVAALVIDELATDIWLYRGSVLVQRFRVASVEQEWDADGNDEARIIGICYRRLLRKSHVRSELVYTATAQDQIIWNLIQHAQAATGGNLGITAGALASGAIRDRIYPMGSNIFDAIVEFTQIDGGVEWDISSTLALDVRPRQSLPLQTMPVQLGVTARRLIRPSTAEHFANAAIAIGNPENTDAVISEAPGLSTDPRGRWEKFHSVTADTQQEVQDLADGLIEQSVSPVSTWSIEMEPDRYFLDAEYGIGDLVTIIQPRSTVYAIGTAAPRIRAQIISRSITQTADGEVSVVLTAIEAPQPPALVASYLVIGGGGGGGGFTGAGGGAGGYRNSFASELSGGNSPTESPLALTEGVAYTVTVGAGGAGGLNLAAATSGSPSTFATITAAGGGRGGSNGPNTIVAANGGAGGSGGGASGHVSGSSNTGGSATASQGFNGGAQTNWATPFPTGGGGGASAAGQTVGGSGNGGNGGAGLTSSITGTAVTRAGGGGGGVFAAPATGGIGGAGGGGNGTQSGTATSGTANTGGGGGGSGNNSAVIAGGSGGSGVVIISYPDFYSDLQISAGLTYRDSTGASQIGTGVRVTPSYWLTNRKVYEFLAGTGTVVV